MNNIESVNLVCKIGRNERTQIDDVQLVDSQVA